MCSSDLSCTVAVIVSPVVVLEAVAGLATSGILSAGLISPVVDTVAPPRSNLTSALVLVTSVTVPPAATVVDPELVVDEPELDPELELSDVDAVVVVLAVVVSVAAFF